jgi:hypothetical protein
VLCCAAGRDYNIDMASKTALTSFTETCENRKNGWFSIKFNFQNLGGEMKIEQFVRFIGRFLACF